MTTTTTTTVIYPPQTIPAGTFTPISPGTIIYPITPAILPKIYFQQYLRSYNPNTFHYPYKRMESQILAAGVALIFGYFISYLTIFLVDTFGALSRGKPDSGRRLRDFVSRHLYVFGIACMLSICPSPGLYGTFHAVFAWLTLLIIVGMYVIHALPFPDPLGSWRTASLVIYYISNFCWYLGIVVYYFRADRYFQRWYYGPY